MKHVFGSGERGRRVYTPAKNTPTSSFRKHPTSKNKYLRFSCAAGVVTKTTDRDSLRYTYNGTRRVRQLALGCESN